MSKIDWSKRDAKFGLAVEGNDDKTIIEAFLNAGENREYWADWNKQILIIIAGNYDRAIKETVNPDVWGLIDRDWRTDDEVAELQQEYPRLLVLPRVMIENYLIAPDELLNLLESRLTRTQVDELKTTIESELERWLQHGALSQILHENGANEFCRGSDGYPKALLDKPLADEKDIIAILQTFHDQIDPTTLIPAYQSKLNEFQNADETTIYHRCIYGKDFFNQVVVSTLNQIFVQQSRDMWIDDLLTLSDDCHTDLIPILQKLLH